MNDERIVQLLRELRAEPVPPDSMARVRMRIDERLAAPTPGRWVWLWAALASGALCVAFMPMMLRRDVPVVLVAAAVVAIAVPARQAARVDPVHALRAE